LYNTVYYGFSRETGLISDLAAEDDECWSRGTELASSWQS